MRHPSPPSRALGALAVIAAAGGLSAGCGSSGSGPAATSGPATPTSTAPVIAVTLSDQGCTPDSFSLHPGTTIFSVTNSGSTDVEEMEIRDQQGHVRGDVEGVQPGQTRSFVVDLPVGSYLVRCPQEATSGGTITVA